MITFAQFVSSLRVTATPRGDFIADAKMLIELDAHNRASGCRTTRVQHFREPENENDLVLIMAGRNACDEAIAEGRKVWRQYIKQAGAATRAALEAEYVRLCDLEDSTGALFTAFPSATNKRLRDVVHSARKDCKVRCMESGARYCRWPLPPA